MRIKNFPSTSSYIEEPVLQCTNDSTLKVIVYNYFYSIKFSLWLHIRNPAMRFARVNPIQLSIIWRHKLNGLHSILVPYSFILLQPTAFLNSPLFLLAVYLFSDNSVLLVWLSKFILKVCHNKRHTTDMPCCIINTLVTYC